MSDSEAAFKVVFTTNFNRLRHYAFSIVRDQLIAEEMVQNVFCRLWEKFEQTGTEQLHLAYLYKSVHNESLNYLKQSKQQARFRAAVQREGEMADTPAHSFDSRILEEEVSKAVNGLPEQCRTIFQLSRMEDMKYREIADTLGISVKTVETQMSKALRTLRKKLAHFLPLLIMHLL